MSSNLLGVITSDHYTGSITFKDYEAVLHNQLLMIMPSYILPNNLKWFLINTNMTLNSLHNHFNRQLSVSFDVKRSIHCEADFNIFHHSYFRLYHMQWRNTPQQISDFFQECKVIHQYLVFYFQYLSFQGILTLFCFKYL